VVDGKAWGLLKAHDAQRRRDRPPPRREQGACHQHQGVAPDPSLRWVVNGLEFGRSLRSLRDILVRRVPTSWTVPGGSADGEDRLGC
jgi:hypothetical protein